jgi:hypothetical protein
MPFFDGDKKAFSSGTNFAIGFKKQLDINLVSID